VVVTIPVIICISPKFRAFGRHASATVTITIDTRKRIFIHLGDQTTP
jgi:hypothetical protein